MLLGYAISRHPLAATPGPRSRTPPAHRRNSTPEVPIVAARSGSCLRIRPLHETSGKRNQIEKRQKKPSRHPQLVQRDGTRLGGRHVAPVRPFCSRRLACVWWWWWWCGSDLGTSLVAEVKSRRRKKKKKKCSPGMRRARARARSACLRPRAMRPTPRSWWRFPTLTTRPSTGGT